LIAAPAPKAIEKQLRPSQMAGVHFRSIYVMGAWLTGLMLFAPARLAALRRPPKVKSPITGLCDLSHLVASL
jgi:hypothetical protein